MKTDRIICNYGELILTLSEAVDMVYQPLSRHQQRTAYIAFQMARSLSSELNINTLVYAALLHDIGVLSCEEKMKLHYFEEIDPAPHCIRGELLLGQIPFLKHLAPIIRDHHKPWSEWSQPIGYARIMMCQIILLADYVERLIDRKIYILHQAHDIIKQVLNGAGLIFHNDIVDLFLTAAVREEFWLQLEVFNPHEFFRDQNLFDHAMPLSGDKKDTDDICRLFRFVIDFRSTYTATHSTGVAECTTGIARACNLPRSTIDKLQLAAALHDVGKLAVPTNLLEKPGALSSAERAVIQCHTFYTNHILKKISGFGTISSWASLHHEQLDGKGYPYHYKDHEIPEEAKIITVADITTALTERRPYRKQIGKDAVAAELLNLVSENKISADPVHALLDNYNEISRRFSASRLQSGRFYLDHYISLN